MPDLIAQGNEAADRWRKTLPAVEGGSPLPLGRTSEPYAVPWDSRVSRVHAHLRWDGRLLHVARDNHARNPIFFRGRQDDEFSMQIGEHFVIGNTSFVLTNQRVEVEADTTENPPVIEQSFTATDLNAIRYRDAQRRIDALGRLPQIISASGSDEALVVRVVNLLMTAISHATFVAIVCDCGPEAASPREKIQVLHWDSRDLQRRSFAPSRSLIRRALTIRQSVLHTWHAAREALRGVDGEDSVDEASAGDALATSAHTQMANVDWAFCVPMLGEGADGWAIYVAGSLDQLSDSAGDSPHAPAAARYSVLQEEMKFAELAATTMAAVRQSRWLQQQQDVLRPFFAPVVREAILRRGNRDPLRPCEADVSVLFCDLRGFSKTSEQMEDRLLELLRRVSDALGVTTRNILLRDGVVGDFHGDAAMGFWGWPLPSGDYIERAAAAALAIDAEFKAAAAVPEHPLAGFHAGLGIASGRAVAGQIGTVDQVKITVFGPVVNLASRLEGLTKQLHAAVLVDETTADHIRSLRGPESMRVRRVAKVLPAGLERPLVVSQLLPPAGQGGLSDAAIECYERALADFQEGRWDAAFDALHGVPASDRVKDFLTVYIASHGRRPPPRWNGVIMLQQK